MNRKLKSVILAGAAISLWGGNALAADIAPPASDWTGFYFGVGGGGAFNFSETDAAGYAVAAGDDTNDCAPDDPCELIDAGSGKVFGEVFQEFSPQAGAFSAGRIGDGHLSSAGKEIVGIINDYIGGPLVGGDDVPGGGDNDSGAASAFGTIEGGFDYQVGSNFLVGLNAAFNLGSVTISDSADSESVGAAEFDLDGIDGGFAGGTSHLDTDLELGNSWSLGARAGFLVSESILLFASGGYISTKAELKASYDADYLAAGLTEDDGMGMIPGGGMLMGVNSSNDDWMNGYYLGAGVETLLTESVSFKMEYRFADLGSIETTTDYRNFDDEESLDSAFENGGAGAAGVTAEANPIVHSIRATVNWRF